MTKDGLYWSEDYIDYKKLIQEARLEVKLLMNKRITYD